MASSHTKMTPVNAKKRSLSLLKLRNILTNKLRVEPLLRMAPTFALAFETSAKRSSFYFFMWRIN